jgi:hypothetical protein
VTMEEIMFRSARKMLKAMHSPTEAELKELLKSDRLKAVQIL